MALTQDQKDLLAFMAFHPSASAPTGYDNIKARRALSDDDAVALIATWAAEKRADPNTTQGTLAKIAALGG